MDVYGSVLEDVDNEVIDGLDGLRSGPGPGCAVCPRSQPWEWTRCRAGTTRLTRRNRSGAEGSRTPGLLDATEAL